MAGAPESTTFFRGHWLVYLNGIEVPCPSVTVSYGVNKIPEATLNFPPHRLLERLGAEDRLDVAVFYLDHFAGRQGKPAFRLLFDGEIVGWSYRSTGMGRMISFNAIADISIWTQLQYYFINTTEALVTSLLEQPRSASTYPQVGVAYPYSLLKKGLIYDSQIPSQTAPDVQRPYDILTNMNLAMTSNTVPPYQQTRVSHSFFGPWAAKRNFANRFFATPVFEAVTGGANLSAVFPIFEGAQGQEALAALRDYMATPEGAKGSLFQVLTDIFSLVGCELAMIPTPAVAPVNIETGDITATDPGSGTLRLLNYFSKPYMYFGVPPRCNVIFPSMVTAYSYQESYLDQPTRLYVNDQLMSSIYKDTTWSPELLAYAYPPEADTWMKKAQALAKNSTQTSVQNNTGKDVIIWPEEFYRGPKEAFASVPPWFTLLVNKIIEKEKANNASQATNVEYLGKLFGIYAKYAYFRERYAQRGGAVDMAFNPYIVPGFPCVVFDHRTSAYDTLGYVINVSHTLDASSSGGGSMRTSINYSYGRTIQEMLSQIVEDTKLEPTRRLQSAPADPVPSVAEATQNVASANDVYLCLYGFYGDKQRYGNRAVSIQQLAKSRGTTNWVNVAFDVQTGLKPADYEQTIEKLKDAERTELVPVGDAVKAFEDYESAMRYVARPICTLNTYIAFLNGGKTYANKKYFDGTSALYYPVIKDYPYTKVANPGPAVTGASAPVSVNGTLQSTPYTGQSQAVPVSYPQVRDDWTTRIKAYLAVLNSQVPLR